MKGSTISVVVATKSKTGADAIESLLDNPTLRDELMKRIKSMVSEFIKESGVMGTKPYEVFAGEHQLQKLMREKLKASTKAVRDSDL